MRRAAVWLWLANFAAVSWTWSHLGPAWALVTWAVLGAVIASASALARGFRSSRQERKRREMLERLAGDFRAMRDQRPV